MSLFLIMGAATSMALAQGVESPQLSRPLNLKIEKPAALSYSGKKSPWRRKPVSAASTHTAQGMVENWEAKRQDEQRCSPEEVDLLRAKSDKKKTNPSCGNYRP